MMSARGEKMIKPLLFCGDYTFKPTHTEKPVFLDAKAIRAFEEKLEATDEFRQRGGVALNVDPKTGDILLKTRSQDNLYRHVLEDSNIVKWVAAQIDALITRNTSAMDSAKGMLLTSHKVNLDNHPASSQQRTLPFTITPETGEKAT
jgi:hypothetical protein